MSLQPCRGAVERQRHLRKDIDRIGRFGAHCRLVRMQMVAAGATGRYPWVAGRTLFGGHRQFKPDAMEDRMRFVDMLMRGAAITVLIFATSYLTLTLVSYFAMGLMPFRQSLLI